MKRTLFISVSVAALFSATPVLAQSNTSTLTQSGANNDAAVSQLGSDATSDIIQSGLGTAANPNRVSVTQRGANASSSVTQSGTVLNRARVDQNGENDSTITQAGGRNSAEVEQDGDGNGSIVTQRGVGNDVGNAFGGANTGVQQTGSENSSVVIQDPSNNAGARVTQLGDRNESNINQSLAVTGGDDTNAIVSQTGDDNRSDVNQTARENDALVTQSGNWNDSLINQTGAGANAQVTQLDGDNSSEVQQSADGTAVVRQSGTNGLPNAYTPDEFRNNRSLITQTANGADADVSQTGTVNRSTVTQNAAAVADVVQNGTYNNSTVNQMAGANGASASVTQGGDYGDNFSTVNQSGDATAIVNQRNIDPLPPQYASPSNDSFIDQSADGAFANVDQTGDDNVSDVIQQSAATAQVIQNGTDNSSAVNQFGGAGGSTAVVAQGDAGGQSFRFADRPALDRGSINNQSTVNQSGFDFAIVGQSGEDNVSRLTQSGDGDAFVQQVGSRNESEVNQSGFQRGRDNATRSFAIDVQQLGDDGFSIVNQSGGSAVPASQPGANRDGNIVTVRQQDGSSEARSTIDQGGTDNVASITQGGIGNESFLTQTGAANTATVSQMSSDNLSTVTQGGMGNTAIVTQGGM